MFTRILQPAPAKSWFLFGPRQTGKSTLVRALLGPDDLYVDLLPQRSFLNYAKNPGRLREEVEAHRKRHGDFTCVIDEVQKIPTLLDEVHGLIESTGITFILTGSSARKLRRGGSNLLAGRAYTYRLFPLTFTELGDAFDLDRALRAGCLPPVWTGGEPDWREFLRAYAETYLREEVAAEGLVRNIGPFSQFLDIAAANDGEIVNFTNVARECSVSVKTVQQYYQILEDTFLATQLPAWRSSPRKRLVSHPRYYFFDPGVTNALAHTLGAGLDPKTRGRRFEQFVVGQIAAAIHYRRLDYQLYYWRTHHGAEVDLLICRGSEVLCAVEVKSSRNIVKEGLDGVASFRADHPQTPVFVLGDRQHRRLLATQVTVLSWDDFIVEELESL
jgi:predicted AAA+ superfamily ATPase